MHVLSFEYVVPRVLVSLCVKFDMIPIEKHDLLTFYVVDVS
jgi:hypothetical protein